MSMELYFTGKTVEDATAAALQQLGIAREEIGIEVVEMPTRRLFRSTPAKIRVTLLAEVAAEEEKAQKEAARAKAAEKAARPQKPQDKPAEKSAEKPADKPKAARRPDKPATVKTAEKVVEKTTEPAAAAAAAANGGANDNANTEAAPAAPHVISQDKIDLAVSYLTTVATDMGVEDFAVIPVQSDETLILKVEGEGLGLLIGRRGETMEALSHLTGLVVNRLGGDYQKVALDVAGYRSKRESDLESLARRIGAKVAKTGRSHTMEPMNPYERRIIHSTISKMEGVTSESTGQGDTRRVVISCTDPAKAAAARNTSAGNGSNSRSGRGGRGGRGGNSRGGRDGERGERGGYSRGGRGGRGGDRREAPRTEYKERSREPVGAPVAGERTETVNDAPNVSLYGKIEL